ncbi:MAG: type II secretion system GspH family protein [Parcubacteria group bacterium]|nr:type II secretion system GspH family protein [Parcubacteria group bacterium]MCR4342750.1 type II secretion system GspH family protein [Patescibacteria group bacterium]
MNNKFKKINNSKSLPAGRQGFTILEMIVAIAVFTVVMTMAMESILNINDAQKKIESFRSVSDNLNFALDAMSREIRTGDNYSSTGDTFSFINARLENITYQLSGNQLIRSDGVNEFPLTDSKISIDSLAFDLRGESSGDNFQPIVRINLSASSGVKEKEQSKIELQASVSQLAPDS